MARLTRKQLLKGGVIGAATLAALPLEASVALADERGRGHGKHRARDGGHVAVHVHGRVTGTGDAKDLAFDLNVDAAGRRRGSGPVTPLSGAGWDSQQFDGDAARQAGSCYFAQRGMLMEEHGDETLHLRGAVLLTNTPGFLGAEVTTTANLRTGEISWRFRKTTAPTFDFTFSGVGVVTKID